MTPAHAAALGEYSFERDDTGNRPWAWAWTSPGGASISSNHEFKTKGAAKAAAEEWVATHHTPKP